MTDPVYFHRLPIPRGEKQGWASRDRLFRQQEMHLRQREAAKARALAEGFPGVTADTPVEPPFFTWSEADICPVHRFLMAEHMKRLSTVAKYCPTPLPTAAE